MSKLYLSGTTDAIKGVRTARASHWAKTFLQGYDSGVEIEVTDRSLHEDGEILTYSVSLTAGANGAHPHRHIMTIRADGKDGNILEIRTHFREHGLQVKLG